MYENCTSSESKFAGGLQLNNNFYQNTSMNRISGMFLSTCGIKLALRI